VLVVLAMLGRTTPGDAQAAPSLTIVGESGTPRTLDLAALQALPQAAVVVEEADGAPTTFRGPTLRELATLAGAPTGRALRGPAMVLAVLAEASDGYRVGYMLSEIDEQFGARTAVVALSANGSPLPEGDGPLRIIVPEERQRARWVRQLTMIRLVRLGP
jgi:DMSO/TMAO reductase YedYZ molybdopterin-dependent catalytic subunit